MMNVAPELQDRVQQEASRRHLVPEQLLDQLVQEGLRRLARGDEVIERYEQRELTHGQAAALLGMSRAEFLDELGRRGVSPFQYDASEVLAEAGLG